MLTCQKNIPLVFIGTSFIGMVSSKVQGSYFRLAAGIYLVVFTSTRVISFKVSGALGTLAFISLLTTMGVLILF
jgi:hypothetical protein